LTSVSTEFQNFPTQELSISKSVDTTMGFDMIIIVGVTFIGWVLFAMFGGIGFAALPIDMIMFFKNRPALKSPKEMAETCIVLRLRTAEMIDGAKMIKKAKEDREDISGRGLWKKMRNEHESGRDLAVLKKKIFELEEAVVQYN